MTHLDTLVNGGLIVHWPLAGKMHGDAWAADTRGVTSLSCSRVSLIYLLIGLMQKENSIVEVP